MKNNIEKALDDFVEVSQSEEEQTKIDNTKKVVLDEREGLIERFDKVFVTKDGKQLLREIY